ncbi:MAG: CvpA family protein [Acidobacteria bacterium]|nr:CvpA family protein [Acidobacteriota bacterium]
MATPQLSPAPAAGGKSELARRLIIAVLVFGITIVVAMSLPRVLPGEMSAAEMAAHPSPGCSACPPTDQIAAAGILATSDGVYVNVRFAAQPLNTRLGITLEGDSTPIELVQAGKGWKYAGKVRPGSQRVTGITQRNNQVIIALPATVRAGGVAVSTGTGDRLPQTGFIAPTYPAPPHFNATDFVLLVALAITAWYGYKRGLFVELADLAVLIVSVTIAALVYKPVAAAFSDVVGSSGAAATIAGGLIVTLLAFAGITLVRRNFPRLGSMVAPFDARTSGVMGGILGCVRQLPLIAMILAAGTDLALLHWASRSIQSSLFAASLMHAWRTLFSA